MSYDSIGVLGQVMPAPAAGPAEGPAAVVEPEGEGLLLVGTAAIYGDRVSHRSDALAGVRTGAEVALAPAVAAGLGLADGGRAVLTSPFGSATLAARADAGLSADAAFVTLGVPGAGVERLLPPDGGPVRVRVEAAPPVEDAA